MRERLSECCSSVLSCRPVTAGVVVERCLQATVRAAKGCGEPPACSGTLVRAALGRGGPGACSGTVDRTKGRSSDLPANGRTSHFQEQRGRLTAKGVVVVESRAL